MYGPNGRHPTIEKLVALLENDVRAAERHVTDVAGELNISVCHLQHLIRRDLGVTYTVLARRHRVALVRRLMHENPGLTISEVATRCGYELGQLYRHFMQELSASPSAVRHQDALAAMCRADAATDGAASSGDSTPQPATAGQAAMKRAMIMIGDAEAPMPPAAMDGDADRWAVVVAGMHRSGTSVCASVMWRLGADLPRQLIPADRHNPEGYFEPKPIVAINERLLAAVHSSWMDWRPLCDLWWRAPQCAPLVEALRAAVESEFEAGRRLLIKDPRIGRMCPLWQELLAAAGYRTLFLLPFRHPVAVARSLHRRSRMSRSAAYLTWLRYVLDAEAATRDQPRILLDYESLVDDATAAIQQLAARLPWQARQPAASIVGSVKPDLDHQRASGAELRAAPAVVIGAYQTYRKLLEDPLDGDACRTLSVIRSSFDAMIASAARRRQSQVSGNDPARTLADLDAAVGSGR